MLFSKRFVLLTVLVLAFTATWGCAPCSDYKELLTERDATIVDLQAQVAEREATIAEGQQLANDLREQIAQVEAEKDVLVEQLGEVVTVTIPDKVLFASGQTMILDTMVPTLEALRNAINEYPAWDIHIEGYTDSQKIWPDFQEVWPTNWELGASRAAAVTRYMTNSLEMDAMRFAVVSYGPFHPIGDNMTTEGRKQNRFVRIVLHKPESLWARNR
ncbi:OmpA family protein [bacterium]|nr:OmpA family protein [bacterium]